MARSFRRQKYPEDVESAIVVILSFSLTFCDLADFRFTTNFRDALCQRMVQLSSSNPQLRRQKMRTKLECFHSFPKNLLSTWLMHAWMIFQTKGHSDTMSDLNSVESCKTEWKATFIAQLNDQLNQKTLPYPERDQRSWQWSETLRSGAPFIPAPSIESLSIAPHRLNELLDWLQWVLEPRTGDGNSNRRRCKFFSEKSIFSQCSENQEVEENVDQIMAVEQELGSAARSD